MVGYAFEISQAQVNFDLLCDVSILLGLACLMPLLETMHQLIKVFAKEGHKLCM
jgi:hypothetical protein